MKTGYPNKAMKKPAKEKTLEQIAAELLQSAYEQEKADTKEDECQ